MLFRSVTGQASSVDNEIALFSGTGGKTIKRATTTGVLKASSGVIAAAVSGTDYAPATSGTSILYGSGSGGFSNVTVGTGLSFAAGTLAATGGGGGSEGYVLQIQPGDNGVPSLQSAPANFGII